MCKLSFSLLVIVFLSFPAQAQLRNCLPTDAAHAELAKKYKEMPVAIGVTSGGGLVEVLTEAEGLTWTILLNLPTGLSCVVAAGEGWRSIPKISLDPET